MPDVQQVLDDIDDAVFGWLDAMRWSPELESLPEPSAPPPGERIPYTGLTEQQRERLHAWVDLHGVDHKRVPIEAPLDFDEQTGEWRIDVYAVRDGKFFVGPDGEVARRVLRRRWMADLPWPVWADF